MKYFAAGEKKRKYILTRRNDGGMMLLESSETQLPGLGGQAYADHIRRHEQEVRARHGLGAAVCAGNHPSINGLQSDWHVITVMQSILRILKTTE